MKKKFIDTELRAIKVIAVAGSAILLLGIYLPVGIIIFRLFWKAAIYVCTH